MATSKSAIAKPSKPPKSNKLGSKKVKDSGPRESKKNAAPLVPKGPKTLRGGGAKSAVQRGAAIPGAAEDVKPKHRIAGSKKIIQSKDNSDADTKKEKKKVAKTKKDERAESKKKLVKRKMAKTNYELVVEMKKIWEELRRHKLQVEKRRELCSKLQALISGKEKEFSKAHDTCRVVQCLYKYGNEEQRSTLFDALKEAVVDMAKSKYSIYLVKKMLKVGSKSQKSFVIGAFMGEARKLLKHRVAGHMVEYVYNMYANAAQRSIYSRQFYGPTFTLLAAGTEGKGRSLGQVLAAEPHHREAVLRHLKEALETMVRKESLTYTLVHELFLDYFVHSSDTERQAMAEVLQDHVAHLAHTREGAKVGTYCVWFGTTKVRKAIVKSLKPYVEKMCADEFSPLVLYAIFDVVDDTQLVQKVILQPMSKVIGDMVGSQYGRKVLHYLLNPRDPVHFLREIVEYLRQGDTNPVSKKESTKRYSELLLCISPPIVEYVTNNMPELVTDNASLLVVENVLLHAAGDTSFATRAFVNCFGASFMPNSGHLIENTACHIVMKRLIANDQEKLKLENGQIGLFSSAFLTAIPASALRTFINCNRGCFVFLSMLKVGEEEVIQKVKAVLKPAIKHLKTKTFPGAVLLLQQMKA